MKINGTPIPDPTDLLVGIYRISKADRLADGSMAIDIIAIKRRVDCSWAVITGAEIKAIQDELDNGTFYSIEYVDPAHGETHTMTAYVGDISQAAWFTRDGVRYWKDFSLSFIEK